ncbi:alginate lyase family protein [Sporomusa sp.]|uniref:alginate lyase family protein n=1 Tax=Sporomusa sp. TaxID=2078658 RepID=UPI002C68486D|nr:alginate lyase family protein [Sporomusa sp.]HWR41975.1 alginate lyase family protein [Sporomusa sp.]
MFRFILCILCYLTFVSLPSSGQAYVSFLTAEQIDTVKTKAQTDLDAKKALLLLTRQADRAVAQPAKIPKEYGGLAQDYLCPNQGVLLSYDEKTGAYRCPVDNKQYFGEKLDAAQRFYVHMKNSRATKDLGLTYALTGDNKYAVAGRDILLQYAKNWSEYKNPNTKDDHGHLFWQVLDETQFATNIAWGYNLIYPALTVEEQQTIEKELLLPLYSIIQAQKTDKISMNRTWENAASAMLGFAIDNPVWYKAAIEGPLGFKDQVDKGVLTTGLWSEAPLGNHYSALSALSAVAEIAPRFSYDLTSHPKFRTMFTAPLTIAEPSDQQPKFQAADLYELAYAWYKDPVFANYLTSTYANPAVKIDRLSYRALFYGLPLTATNATSLSVPAPKPAPEKTEPK